MYLLHTIARLSAWTLVVLGLIWLSGDMHGSAHQPKIHVIVPILLAVIGATTVSAMRWRWRFLRIVGCVFNLLLACAGVWLISGVNDPTKGPLLVMLGIFLLVPALLGMVGILISMRTSVPGKRKTTGRAGTSETAASKEDYVKGCLTTGRA